MWMLASVDLGFLLDDCHYLKSLVHEPLFLNDNIINRIVNLTLCNYYLETSLPFDSRHYF
jgi:hypothetical protein